MTADLILVNGRFTTLDRVQPNPEAVAIADDRFRATVGAREILPSRGRTPRSSTSAGGA